MSRAKDGLVGIRDVDCGKLSERVSVIQDGYL